MTISRCLFSGVKVTIIHPATEKHIHKFTAKESIIVNETPQLYKDVLLEHLKESAFNVQVLVTVEIDMSYAHFLRLTEKLSVLP